MEPAKETDTIDIKDFRQPLITAQGIILGFVLGFVGDWVTEPQFTLEDWSSRALLIGSCLAICCFVSVLMRILSAGQAARTSRKHYSTTLRFFFAGVVILLASFMLSAIL